MCAPDTKRHATAASREGAAVLRGPWKWRPGSSRRAVPGLLLLWLLHGPVHGAELRDAVDSALLRTGGALEDSGSSAPRNGWLAANPYLESSYIDSRPERGTDELEIALNLPLKGQAQRSADARVLELEEGVSTSAQRFRRWYVSGQVRERAWAQRIAARRHATLTQRSDAVESLAGRAQQLSRSGAMTRYQRLLIEQEALDTGIDLRAAEASLDRARRAFEQLTGFRSLPSPLTEDLVGSTPDFSTHPRLVQLERQQAQQQAILEASAPNRANWNLSLIARNFESPGLTEDQIGVAVQLPLNMLGSRSVGNDANLRQQRRAYALARDELLLDLRNEWLDLWSVREGLLQEAQALERSLEIADELEEQVSLLRARNEIEAEVLLSRTLDVLERKARLKMLAELIGRNTARLNQLSGHTL